MKTFRHSAILLLVQIALTALTVPTAGAVDTSGTPPSPEAVEEERAKAVRELTESLAATVEKHGSDAVGLQAALLMSSLTGGAVLATEVRVVGPSPSAGSGYLRIDVNTGVVFDSDTTTTEGRGATLWKAVASPALARLETTDLRPAGLDLLIGYDTQSFRANSKDKPDFDRPFDPHTVRVAIAADDLAELVAGTIDSDALLARCTLVHDEVLP